MTEIRLLRAGDPAALNRIALATGDGGDDAAALYRDPDLLGLIYAAPYAAITPDTVLVAADAAGVGGYIVGAADTAAFEARLERDWWPALRARYPDPDGPRAAWTPDQRRMHAIHHPTRAPPPLAAAYPAHLHINLLPRLRGRGVGRALMAQWLALVRQRGARGVHLAVGTDNAGALRFYAACGFGEARLVPPPARGACWRVMALSP